jgi:catechol 2,3-dioxygenase-like lactoylglutathione lyase family enzyme
MADRSSLHTPGSARHVGPALLSLAILLGVGACAPTDSPAPSETAQVTAPAPPGIQALNAFYYYDDVDAAWEFYSDVLGFETAADYGFAKIMRIADASYVTLVDAARGMHSSDEPKAVTLAMITEQVEGWYQYLLGQDVGMRTHLGDMNSSLPHNGFVAVDPEGYLLEFERFNAHEENANLMPILDGTSPLGGMGEVRPEGLAIQGTVLWLYYDELAPMEMFWAELLGQEMLLDQGWAKAYPVSATGFIGLVDGSRGLHRATELAGVTISIITGEVGAWFERAKTLELPLRTEELGNESGRVTVFVGYDPAGYFLEWDTFLDVDGNGRLLELLTR